MKEIILTRSLLTRFNNDVKCRICDKVFEIGDKLIRTGKPSNPKFYCIEHYYAESDVIESEPKSLLNKIKDKVMDIKLIPVTHIPREWQNRGNENVYVQEHGYSRLFLKFDELEIAYYKRMGIDMRPNIRWGID